MNEVCRASCASCEHRTVSNNPDPHDDFIAGSAVYVCRLRMTQQLDGLTNPSNIIRVVCRSILSDSLEVPEWCPLEN